jgi:hypothetical protein
MIKLYHAQRTRSIRIVWLLEVLGIPYEFATVAFPALRHLPALYSWRISRIDRRYRQLMALERSSLGDLSAHQRAVLIERLAQIEKSVIALRMPGSHAEPLYVLREHIQFVRENLARPPLKLDDVQAFGDQHST